MLHKTHIRNTKYLEWWRENWTTVPLIRSFRRLKVPSLFADVEDVHSRPAGTLQVSFSPLRMNLLVLSDSSFRIGATTNEQLFKSFFIAFFYQKKNYKQFIILIFYSLNTFTNKMLILRSNNQYVHLF